MKCDAAEREDKGKIRGAEREWSLKMNFGNRGDKEETSIINIVFIFAQVNTKLNQNLQVEDVKLHSRVP